MKSDRGELMSDSGVASRRASQGPISTNYYKRKEELEEINRENLRINMKIVTAQAKIQMTSKNRRIEEMKYEKYKQFASRHNANLPKLDPLVSKRLHNERRDEEHHPDLTG